MYQAYKTLIQKIPLFKTRIFSCLLIFTPLFFSACSSEADNNNVTSNTTSSASIQTPKHVLSPELTTVYKETCSLCHTNSSTGAPISGDTEAWQQILSKGIDETLERSMNGYGGMPPAGQCFECTPEEMIELIKYMSQQP
jgi:cytochrome c5